ncbi:hypothetical protein PG993_012470 [Apiospora rasikravindrae]|uniref:Uncharacterized protein n=1 Tax=Apiospora rasikravindrae TaxID=990691 RepID=A0ABR1S2K5_9PEZI
MTHEEILPTVAESREAETDCAQTYSMGMIYETQSQKDWESERGSMQETCPCQTHTPVFENKILSAVADLIDSQFRAEIPHLVDNAVHEATEELQKIAQNAAREEMGKYVIEIHLNDSGDEELVLAQVMKDRLKELYEDTLERVFMQ